MSDADFQAYQETIAALTAEVERQKERGDLLRAEMRACVRERDEAEREVQRLRAQHGSDVNNLMHRQLVVLNERDALRALLNQAVALLRAHACSRTCQGNGPHLDAAPSVPVSADREAETPRGWRDAYRQAIRSRSEWRARAEAAEDAVAAVARLCEEGLAQHVPVLMYRDVDPEGIPYCGTCEVDDAWPCPDHRRYSAIRAALPKEPLRGATNVRRASESTVALEHGEPGHDCALPALPPQEEEPRFESDEQLSADSKQTSKAQPKPPAALPPQEEQ